MKQIKLNNKTGREVYALVDDEDFEFVNQFKWHLNKAYADSYAKGKFYKMHRLVMKAKPGQQIDHINHNELDNRKENLRFCTQTENNRHIRMRRDNTVGYKNVMLDGSTGHFRPYIYVDGKPIFFGSFIEKRHAAMAHAMFAPGLHGEFALTNFTASEIVAKFLDE